MAVVYAIPVMFIVMTDGGLSEAQVVLTKALDGTFPADETFYYDPEKNRISGKRYGFGLLGDEETADEKALYVDQWHLIPPDKVQTDYDPVEDIEVYDESAAPYRYVLRYWAVSEQ